MHMQVVDSGGVGMLRMLTCSAQVVCPVFMQFMSRWIDIIDISSKFSKYAGKGSCSQQAEVSVASFGPRYRSISRLYINILYAMHA